MTSDKEKTEVLSAFFAIIFISKTDSTLGTQPTELEDRVREQNEAFIIQGKMISDLIYHLNTQKYM